MATKLWNQEIDKSVDWGGDLSTGNAPVSGEFVQKFIKDQLAKKFGHFEYDTVNKKYLVFADKEDSDLYAENPTANSHLLLTSFDAPAPASIVIQDLSEQDVTILSTDFGNRIWFEYIIKDKSDNPMNEPVTARFTFNNNGTIRTMVKTYEADIRNYKTGTRQEEIIDDYLTVGINNITVLLTGASSQASTTISFRYTVVELKISSTFDYKGKHTYNSESLNPFSENVLDVPYTIEGQGDKYIQWFINGIEVKQNEYTGVNQIPANYNPLGSDYRASSSTPYSSTYRFFLTNQNNELYYPFVDGKNTLQFRIYVKDSDGNKIYSQIKYFEFVLYDVNSSLDKIYILYKQDLDAAEDVFKRTDVVKFSSQQYEQTSFGYSIFSLQGKSADLTFTITKKAANGNPAEKIAELYRSLNSGAEDTFLYTFLTYGEMEIFIQAKNASGEVVDSMTVIIDVAKAGVEIEVLAEDRVLNLEALNRSNSEPDEERLKWESGDFKATFNNVFWNSSSGWDGETLVLNNRAQCYVNYNPFLSGRYDRTIGFTLELDFEVVNVQNEEAVIFSLEDRQNTSYIRMTASEIRIQDNGSNEVYTKFNSNTRIKLAIIINPFESTTTWVPDFKTYKNCVFLCINGILDKCDSTNGNFTWTSPTTLGMTFGNADGEAGIKIHSIRAYNKAITLDEELINYIAECPDIVAAYKKNDVYLEGTNTVSLDLLTPIVPTAVFYGDMDKFNSFDNKKDNMEFDVEFYDPSDPNRDFFARGAWVSNQGTSSLSYPIRNLRLYFGKTKDKQTQDNSAKYFTEVYLAGEFTHGEMHTAEGVKSAGRFFTNSKTCDDGYHKLYSYLQAKRVEEQGIQLFYKAMIQEATDTTEAVFEYVPCSLQLKDYNKAWIGNEAQDAEFYIQAYSPIVGDVGTDAVDSKWKQLCDLRLSGWKLFTMEKPKTVINETSGHEYTIYTPTKVKNTTALENSEEAVYYTNQAFWKQFEKSGYTKLWTYKTDYAESSMCNNAGTGRLWNDCMAECMLSGVYIGQTKAQAAIQAIKTANDLKIDIRTACDGKPIVVFNAPMIYNANKSDAVYDNTDENNKENWTNFRKYGNAQFIGLYNIMTDKGSTNLFGFEDIYDQNGRKIFDSTNVECWECLTNAGQFSQGRTIVCETNESTSGEDRPIWGDYEARWPDADKNWYAHTMHLESFWRFINFCKPAVNYLIGDIDGYTLSNYAEIKEDEVQTVFDNGEVLYKYGGIDGGNEVWTEFNYGDDINLIYNNLPLYRYLSNINYEDITLEASNNKISGEVYTGKVKGWDVKYGYYHEDVPFDVPKIDGENIISRETKIEGSEYEEDYYIKAYLTRSGNRYNYTDSWGTDQTYAGTPDIEVDSRGDSYAGKTFMQYFSEKKYEHLDVQRVAMYYVYVMRFAAVDQVVKNTMMTTEDGQHYYFINYDNDTILGVRNDGNMVFPWNIDRKTYDYSKNAFAFAGEKSVLWNLLECDADFMQVVKDVDDAMYTSGVLSKEVALHMYNVLQEGTWGPRLYNINEEVKYLSQWTGVDSKYLKFIHGSANQYRSWFIENRFDLYDSKWKSGEFLTTLIRFYMDIPKASSAGTPLFNITAARDSLFFLSNSDGRYKDLPIWNKEVKMDHTELWKSEVEIKGTSSPFALYGSDKIKVLDFSPSIGTNELQRVSFTETSWIKDKGTLMTGFIVGNSDEYREKPKNRYKNLSDQDITIGTTVIPANGYVDLDGTISVGDNSNIVSETLGKTQVPLEELGGLNNIYTLEEVDIRNCFNAAKPITELDIYALNNLHRFRAIGSSITSFIPATGVVLNEVSLPIGRINTIELNEVTFEPLDDPNAPKEIFMYKPDAALKSLILNNVTGIDIKEFVDNWIEACEPTIGIEENGIITRTWKDLHLEMKGVDLKDVPVKWVLDIKKLDLDDDNFTGDVYLIGSGENGTLTQEEYLEIVDAYGDNVFDPNSSLRFTAGDAFFWNVPLPETLATVDGQSNPKFEPLWDNTIRKYYEAQHGVEFEFNGTLFPVKSENSLYYRIQTNNAAKNAWTGLNTADSSTKPNTSITAARNAEGYYNLQITKSGSSFKFISRLDNIQNQELLLRNVVRYVQITPYLMSTNQPVGSPIHIKLNPSVVPSAIEWEAPLGYEVRDINGVNTLVINKNGEIEVELTYENANDVNIDLSSISASLNDPRTNQSPITGVTEITVQAYKGVDGKTHRLIINPKLQSQSKSGTIYVKLGYKTEMDLSANTSATLLEIPYLIETIYSDEYSIGQLETPIDGVSYDESKLSVDGKDIDVTLININITGQTFKFPVKLTAGSNIPIYSIDVTREDIAYKATRSVVQSHNEDKTAWTIDIESRTNTIVDNIDAPFNDEFWVKLVIVPGFDYWLNDTYRNMVDVPGVVAQELWFKVDSSIIFPNDIRIWDQSQEGQEAHEISTIIINSGDTVESGRLEDTGELGQKTFNLKFEPFNNQFTDNGGTNANPVTVPVRFSNVTVKVDGEPYNAAEMPKLSISYDQSTTDLYKPLTIKLGKFKYGSEFERIIDDKVITFVIDMTFDNDGQQRLVTKEISLNCVWSVATSDKAEDLIPYPVNIIGSTIENFEWYFVDVNNQYYEFDADILEELNNADKIDELIGIAKRYDIRNGFADTYDITARNWWRVDPNLSDKAMTDSGKDSNAPYYRIMAYPLAMWDDAFTLYNRVAFNDDTNSTNSPTYNVYSNWTEGQKIAGESLSSANPINIKDQQPCVVNMLQTHRTIEFANLITGEWSMIDSESANFTLICGASNTGQNEYFTDAFDTRTLSKALCNGDYGSFTNISSIAGEYKDYSLVKINNLVNAAKGVGASQSDNTNPNKSGIAAAWIHFTSDMGIRSPRTGELIDDETILGKMRDIHCYIPNMREIIEMFRPDPQTFNPTDSQAGVLVSNASENKIPLGIKDICDAIRGINIRGVLNNDALYVMNIEKNYQDQGEFRKNANVASTVNKNIILAANANGYNRNYLFGRGVGQENNERSNTASFCRNTGTITHTDITSNKFLTAVGCIIPFIDLK